MDYSKFYLKNYKGNDDSDNDNDFTLQTPIQQRDTPQIVYINPDGEEFIPEHTPEIVQYSNNDETYYSEKRYAKKSHLNAFLQFVFISLIVIMSLVVCCDFLSNGKVIAKFTSLAFESNKAYIVLVSPAQDLTVAKTNAYAMRLNGDAGYIIKENDYYYNVNGIYLDYDEANDYAKQNNGILKELSTAYYDDLPENLENYKNYSYELVQKLVNVQNKLLQKEINVSTAIDELNAIKETFDKTFDTMQQTSMESSSKSSIALLSNAQIAKDSLGQLCNTNVSRPNLMCDIRYTACLILVNYTYSK